MSIRESWKTPEWRAQSDALIAEQGTCEWCGAKNGDTYIDSKGVSRRVALGFCHRDRVVVGLRLYRKVAGVMWRAFKKTPEYDGFAEKVVASLPRGVRAKDKDRRVRFAWETENRKLIGERFEAAKMEIIEVYRSLDREKGVILCGKCHFAQERGLVICQTCKKHYHDPKYEACRWCADQEVEG